MTHTTIHNEYLHLCILPTVYAFVSIDLNYSCYEKVETINYYCLYSYFVAISSNKYKLVGVMTKLASELSKHFSIL